MATITWNGTPGNWSDAFRWIGGSVPSSVDTAIINAGFVVNQSAAQALSVQLENSGELNAVADLSIGLSLNVGNGGAGTSLVNVIGGTTSAGLAVNIGNTPANGGIVRVSGSGILQAPSITVGNAASSSLAVFDGGTINASSGITAGNGAIAGTIYIGQQSGFAAAGTINGNIDLANANSALRFRTTDTATYGGDLSGAGSVFVDSAGQTAILTGTNTHSGATSILAGTLQIGNNGTTGTLGSGAVSIAAGATLAFQHSLGLYTNANVISGAGNVVQLGAGSLERLTGNNSYTGTTTIDNSVIAVGSFGASGTLGSGNVILANGALDLIRSDTQLITNTITGAGFVRIYGNHTAVLTGVNSYSGSTEIFDGANTLQVGDGGSTGSLGNSAVSIGTGGTLDFNRSGAPYFIGNAISGAGDVVFRGGAFAVLDGSNSYTGTTTIGAGTNVQVNSNIGSGNILNSGLVDFNNGGATTYAGVISGTGSVRSGGALTLTGENTYAGTTNIAAGTVQVGNNGTTGSLGTGAVTLGGTAVLNHFRSNDATIANAISGFGSFTKSGVGILTLAGAATHFGVTQISGGTLRGGGVNVFSANSLVNISTGAKLDLGGFNQSISGLVGGGIVENSIAAFNTLTLNNSGTNSFSGVIQNGSGSVSLTKNGAGTQTLSGVNTYTGGTVVNAGVLALSGTGSISATGIVSLGAAGRFDISAISGASTSVRDVISGSGSQFILGGKTLIVTNADRFAGAGSVVGSAGTEAVVFNVDSLDFTLAGSNGLTFTNWTDGTDSITINGNAAANILTGDELRATIINGGDGADSIIGGAGNDTLNGGAGNDTINGAGGTNTLAGGANDDTYIVNEGNVTINEAVGEGIDLVQTNKTSFTLGSNVENLIYTGAGGFVGIGNALDNAITGGVGVDQLEGRDGNDTLSDGGGASSDALFGGLGNDVYVIGNRDTSTIESTGQGTDEVRTTFFIYGLQSNIENLTYTDNATHGAGVGNSLDNVITGGTGTDDLFGRVGNDTLRGGTGAANTMLGQEGNDTYVVSAVGDSVIEFLNEGTDTVQTALASFVLRDHVENLVYTGTTAFTGIGASGANSITGGAADDFLSGLDGADILVGKSGADFLLGGTGADQFRYEGGETGFDRISDFVSGTDKIALRDAGFAQTATIALVQGGTPVATTTNSTFLYNVNNGMLSFDVDGTGAIAAVALAQLNGGLTLATSDFLFY